MRHEPARIAVTYVRGSDDESDADSFGHQVHRHREATTTEPVDAFLHALHLRTLRPVLCPAVPPDFIASTDSSAPVSESYRELVYRPTYHAGPDPRITRCVRLRFVPPEDSSPADGQAPDVTALTTGSDAASSDLSTRANLDLAPVLEQLEKMPASAFGRWEIEATVERECSIFAPGGCVDSDR